VHVVAAVEARAAGTSAVTPKTPDWTGDHPGKGDDVSSPLNHAESKAFLTWR